MPDYLRLHPIDATQPWETLTASVPPLPPAGTAWQLVDLPNAAHDATGNDVVADDSPATGQAAGPARRVAGVPLAKRIELLLRTAGELTACDAAAVYLLDEATSQLTLTSNWGKAGRRLTQPTRPLRGQLADLEALLGQAVVIQRAQETPEWRIPEDCGAAACVPIVGAAPLGTLWTFSQKSRQFTHEQVQMLDVVAGRIAAEVERDDLMQESAVLKAWHRNWRRAVQWQQGQRPQAAPLADGWQLAAASTRSAPLAGGYHDWTLLPNEQLAVAVGHAQGDAVESQLTLAALHAGLKSHAPYARSPGRLMQRLNDTFWIGSAGDQFAALGYSTIDATTGDFEFAAAGPVAALWVKADEHAVLHGGLSFLGEDPDALFDVQRGRLEPGDALVLIHGVPGGYGARQSALKDAAPLDAVLMAAVVERPWTDMLARRVRALREVPASQLSTRLETTWREICGGDPADPTLVIVRRER